jgi:hypothetical protein
VKTVNEGPGEIDQLHCCPTSEPMQEIKECEESNQFSTSAPISHILSAIRALRVVRGEYHSSLDTAYRIADDLESMGSFCFALPAESDSLADQRMQQMSADIIAVCHFFIVVLRRISLCLATRISRERSHCPVTKAARERLRRYPMLMRS